jgi:hypothetical protein
LIGGKFGIKLCDNACALFKQLLKFAVAGISQDTGSDRVRLLIRQDR